MTIEDTEDRRGVSPDLGFTVGLGMAFDEAVEWAAREGFDFVELLLDGPYARERISDRHKLMAKVLADFNMDIVVHLPLPVDAGSPFTPVREGAIAEFIAGMDLAVDLVAEKVVFAISAIPDGFETPLDDSVERFRPELYCSKLDKLLKHPPRAARSLVMDDCCRRDALTSVIAVPLCYRRASAAVPSQEIAG